MAQSSKVNEQSPGIPRIEARPLEQVRLTDRLTIWRSPLLSECGVTHAFTTRHGGRSVGPRATLDLAGRGSREGEELAQAEDNYEQLRQGLRLPADIRPIRLHQVHGAAVHLDDGATPPWPPPQADVVISNRPDGLLMVRVADCVPILLHDTSTGAVAAIHSGWRGTVANAPNAAIGAMIDTFGTAPEDLIAAIGPSIGLERFEVGEEVAHAFRLEGLGAFVHPRVPRPHVDLYEAVRFRLIAAGIPADHIEGAPICTFDDDRNCFSYRRDGSASGRMAALILTPGPPPASTSKN